MLSQIEIFTDSSTRCHCMIGKALNGRKKWGTILKALETIQGEESTFGTPQGRKVDPNVRNSRNYSIMVKIQLNFLQFHQHILKMVTPEESHTVTIPHGIQKMEILEYLEGGHFAEHRDGLRGPNHFATMLLFPPAVDEFAHEGGELCIRYEDGNEFVFKSAENREWTYILFDATLLHRCLPVKSGRRIVVKHDLHFDSRGGHSPVPFADPDYFIRID